MFTIFSSLALGIGAGFLLRRFPDIKILGKLITASIVFLLFLLGNSVGKNQAIMQNIGTIGMQALVITIATIGGSVLMSIVVYKHFFKVKKQMQASHPEN